MLGPKNNLEELRRRHLGGGTPAPGPSPPVSVTHGSQADGEKKSKFKPSRSINNSDKVTALQAHNPLPSFSTPGFGKKKPVPARSTPIVEVSSAESSPDDASTSRLPVKRLSSDSSWDVGHPAPIKRLKIAALKDKENGSAAESSRDKGKGREQPYRTIGRSSHSTGFSSSSESSPSIHTRKNLPPTDAPPISTRSSRSLPLSWSDLLGKDDNELAGMLNSNFMLLSELAIRKRAKGSCIDEAVIDRMEEMLTDRNNAIMAIRSALAKGEKPVIPDPMWSNTTRSESPLAEEVSFPSLSQRPPSYAARVCSPAPVSTANTSALSSSTSNVLSSVSVEQSSGSTGLSAVSSELLARSELDVVPGSDDLFADLDDFPAEVTGWDLPRASQSAQPPRPQASIPVSSAVSRPREDLMRTPYYAEIKEKLRTIFNLVDFRSNQLEAITATLAGRDVLVLMPTGGGKSLCYQLPAVCESGTTRGVTIVIGPLLSLMQNQVESLEEKGVDVVQFNGDQDLEESGRVGRRLLAAKKPNILFVTPEKLQRSGRFNDILERLYEEGYLARFVVDESHCVVKWGRDFRDSYKNLGSLRTKFPNVPIMALTATANIQVKTDIMRLLKIEHCEVLSQSMNRPNLNYEVRAKASGRTGVIKQIADFIKECHPNDTGIIYTSSRQMCEEVAKVLREQYRLQARHYHAKVDARDKEEVQQAWQSGKCKIIVATIAFGMGIDKPDVRFVCHHSLPSDLDGYYQETGRAGRDGNPSDCILFYRYIDAKQRRQAITTNPDINKEERDHQVDELQRVVQYCQNDVDCRRLQVLAYYSEKFDVRLCKQGCDNCRNPAAPEKQDVTATAVDIIRLAQALTVRDKERITRNQLVDVIRGSQNAKVKERGWDRQQLFGLGKDTNRERIERIVDRLDNMGLFDQVTMAGGDWSSSYLVVTPKASQFMSKKETLVMAFRATSTKKPANSTKLKKRATAKSFTSDNAEASSSSSRQRTQYEEEASMSLYRDDADGPGLDFDDIYDFQSPRKAYPRTRQELADPIENDSDVEFVDDAPKDPEYIRMQELKTLRKEIAKELHIKVPEELIDDQALFLIATTLPKDINEFNSTLQSADVDIDRAFKPYSRRFLDYCMRQHVLRGETERAQQAKPRSAADLRERFQYQGKFKVPRSRGPS